MKSTISFLILASLLLIQCGIAQKQVKGSGNVTTQTREISSFNEIRVGGAFEVLLKKASSNSIVLEMDDNIHEMIETKVDGNVLKIRTKKGYNLQKTSKMKLTINFTKVNHLDISGACNLSSEDVIESDDLICELSGAGKMVLDINCKTFSSDISGAGSMIVKGVSNFQKLDLSGASSYKAYDLLTKETVVHASGASSARVNTSSKLDAHASGASSIRYKGKPESKDFHKSGAASIEGID
jgi:Putative auto-transporter adhesin, head GIN domain